MYFKLQVEPCVHLHHFLRFLHLTLARPSSSVIIMGSVSLVFASLAACNVAWSSARSFALVNIGSDQCINLYIKSTAYICQTGVAAYVEQAHRAL